LAHKPEVVSFKNMLVLKVKLVLHIAPIGEMRNACKILFGNLKGRDNAEDIGVDGKIILEWILGKGSGKICPGIIWIRTENSGGIL
jgi:hypothetical protein